MRTVIFTLGVLFICCLTEHWGIKLINDPADYKFFGYIFVFAIGLDIVKK